MLQGQTGQQVLLGAYSALKRQVSLGKVRMLSRHQMLDIVIIDGKARGIITRNLVTGKIERHAAHAVVLATGGYGTIYYLSTLAVQSNGIGSNGKLIEKEHFLEIQVLFKFTQHVFLF